MSRESFRIGVTAPGSPFDRDVAEALQALVASLHPDGSVEVVVHPQCFLSAGHFAGDDKARTAAFLEVANDESFDALWCARGGYGACRLVEGVLAGLKPQAAAKAYLGYSDAGSLMAALYGRGFEHVAHGPMPQDLRRAGGEAAVRRALAWLVRGSVEALEPSVSWAGRTAAFNITILSNLIGTPWQPDLADHVLMLEEVSEHMYRIDRSLCHITSNPQVRKAAGLRLGRCSDIPENDRPFAMTEEEVALYWCERSGIPWLGRADVGHDADNKVVPFGALRRR